MKNIRFSEWLRLDELVSVRGAEMLAIEDKICSVLYEHMDSEARRDCDNFRIDEFLNTALGAANLAIGGANLGLKGLELGGKAVKGVADMAYSSLEPNKKGWKWLESFKKSTKSALSMLWKAIKALGIAVVIGACIYIGFRFESIRALFPMLAPLIDQAGSFIAGLTGNFAKEAFIKLSQWSFEFTAWLMSKAMELFGITGALETAKDTLLGASDKANDLINQGFDAIRPAGSVYDSPAWTGSSEVGPSGEFASKYIEPNISSKSIYSPVSKIDQLTGADGLGGALKRYGSNDDVDLINKIAGRKK